MKDKLLSIFRTALVAVGTYLTGKFFLGTELDDNTIAGWISLIVALAASIWGFVDKTVGIEQLQSAVRNVLIALGALFISIGSINDQVLELILLTVDTILGSTLGVASRIKNEKVASGAIPVTKLTGVNPNEQPINPKV